MIKRVKVCDFKISTGCLSDNISWINNKIKSNCGAWIVTLNTEMLARAQSDKNYKQLIKNADILVADGMPIVWATSRNKLGNRIGGRTTGVDLVDALLRQDTIHPFAIIGGINPAATLSRYAGSERRCKYLYKDKVDLDELQLVEFAENIRASGAKILFIALGIPKQDGLAAILRKRIPNLLVIGVGGTFEILTSGSNRAPLWMQNYGLEWLFRFARDPKRLWKRYVLRYPLGIVMLIADYIKTKN